MMTFGVTPIATLPLAWASDQVDPQSAVLAAGLAMTVALVLLAIFNPAARRAR